MKLHNETSYDTRTLRRVITACHSYLKTREGRPLQLWKPLRPGYAELTITVKYFAGRSCSWSGEASYDGRYIILRLARPGVLPKAQRLAKKHPDFTPTPQPGMRYEWLVRLVCHEMMHAYGYRHDQGGCDPTQATVDAIMARLWVQFDAYLPIATPRTPKPPRDLQAERYARVLEREKQWQTKAKRAATALKKLRQQRRYYERQMAARNPTEEEANNA